MNEIEQRKHQEEKQLIINTLKEVYGNKTAAARKLGIHRTTLYKKIAKYKIKDSIQ